MAVRSFLTIVLLACALAPLYAESDFLVRKEALATMEDIVPHDPGPDELVRVSMGNNHAIWGRVFGDRTVAALVAVDASAHDMYDGPAEVPLVLLIWENGWKFRQLAGKVSASTSSQEPSQFHTEQWDWAVKHRVSPDAFYVASLFDLNPPPRNHASWFCDPGSHMLVPTGWRNDAIPSIAGSAITFDRRDKQEDVFDIFKFTDRPGDLIASFNGSNLNGHPSGKGFLVRDPKSGKMVSWWFWQKKPSNGRGDPVQFAISCSGPGKDGLKPQEDAVASFYWDDYDDSNREIDYFLWRLTGLGENSLQGVWDQDGKFGIALPGQVSVNGLPEAVQRFTWPVTNPEKSK